MVQAQADTLERVRAEVRAVRDADRLARETRLAEAVERKQRQLQALTELNRKLDA